MAEKRIPTAAYCRTPEYSEAAVVDLIQMTELVINQLEALDLIETYIDIGHTGDDFNRPAWKRMLRDCRTGRIKCILSLHLDTLGKAYVEDKEFFYESFQSLGVKAIAFLDGIDSSNVNASAPIIHHKTEHIVIRDRYVADMEEGKPSVRPVYGYCKDDDALVIDPQKSEIVKEIFSMALEGEKIADIAKRLTAENIDSPSGKGKWSPTSVSRILRDNTYVGTYERGKRKRVGDRVVNIPEENRYRFEDHHDGIVSAEDFDRVQTILERNVRIKDNDIIAERRDELEGILFCSSCGKKIAYRRSGGKDGVKTARYYCRYHTGENPSGEKFEIAPSIAEADLKEQIVMRCNERLEQLRDAYEEINLTPRFVDEQEQEARKEFIDSLINRVKLSDRVNHGLIPEDRYDVGRRELYAKSQECLHR